MAWFPPLQMPSFCFLVNITVSKNATVTVDKSLLVQPNSVWPNYELPMIAATDKLDFCRFLFVVHFGWFGWFTAEA